MKDNIIFCVTAGFIALIIGMFASCTYVAQVDHNKCVVQSASAEIAKNCERAR